MNGGLNGLDENAPSVSMFACLGNNKASHSVVSDSL